ncbi:MAG: radical SAM protein [Candidatus Nanoarchaeia archaeon]|nr:radical SAM protein [Candidatus Nanoarchaeia archaeon]
MSRVLFVYPNSEGYPIIPLSISTLSGILKYHGHETDLFDITFMMQARKDHEARIKTGQVKAVDMSSAWGDDKVDIDESFKQKIKAFKPDLIAFTVVENNRQAAFDLARTAKRYKNIPIVFGGLFPTIAPYYFFSDDIDYICRGEGEAALLQIANGETVDIFNTLPLDYIFDNYGTFSIYEEIKIDYAPYYNWEPNVYQDWTIFDERHLLKPFMGKVYRTGFFELSRGCPHKCAYCTNDLNQQIFKCLGKYNREKPIDYAIEEMAYLKEKYALELIFFNDENFLTMNDERLDEFCEKYGKKIGLPYFIMTRADSLLKEDRVKKLKESNCITIGIGVETGNQERRYKVLNKHISNEVYEKAFRNCKKYGIRSTANMMIGLPGETPENIEESIEFCKRLEIDSLSLAIYAPYVGSKLRDVCIKEGWMEDRLYDDIGIINNSVLTMPQLTKEQIKEYYMTFSDRIFKGVA